MVELQRFVEQMMRIRWMFLWVVLLMLIPASVSAEYIFLNDGSIIEGVIVSDTTDLIVIKDMQKAQRKVVRRDIMRILYTRLNMGKIYIQKRTGEGIVAYMVDEDRDSYTFRMDLYKPQEFVLQRSEVLFMAEKNPSGLSGTADVDRIEFAWLPPYDEVKEYRLYLKRGKKDEYFLAAAVRGKSAVVKNLPSNTEYYCIVTSVDRDGYESSPSNELRISTGNIPPRAPRDVSFHRNESGDAVLSWSESVDPDGSIAGYRIYMRGDKGDEVRVGETRKSSFILKAGVSFRSLYIRAVDDRTMESNASYAPLGVVRNTGVALMPCFVMPLGSYADILGYGYGLSFDVGRYPVNESALQYGVSISACLIAGKDYGARGEGTDRAILVPFSVFAGYRLAFWSSVALVPRVDAGGMFSRVEYRAVDPVTQILEERTSQGVDPYCAVRLDLELLLSQRLMLRAGCGYGVVWAEERMHLFTAGAGLGVLL